jgi:hypothetical protein
LVVIIIYTDTHTASSGFTYTMAIDLSANGPQFFTMNGINFEKRVEAFDTILIYHQGRRVGIVSTGLVTKIYFDNNMGYYMFGGFDIVNWNDTLNHAYSTNPIVNAHYGYQRRILQELLDTMRAEDTQQILMDIQYTVYQDAVDEVNNMDVDDETDDELEDEYDADNYDYFFGINGIFPQHPPIEPLAY